MELRVERLTPEQLERRRTDYPHCTFHEWGLWEGTLLHDTYPTQEEALHAKITTIGEEEARDWFGQKVDKLLDRAEATFRLPRQELERILKEGR